MADNGQKETTETPPKAGIISALTLKALAFVKMLLFAKGMITKRGLTLTLNEVLDMHEHELTRFTGNAEKARELKRSYLDRYVTVAEEVEAFAVASTTEGRLASMMVHLENRLTADNFIATCELSALARLLEIKDLRSDVREQASRRLLQDPAATKFLRTHLLCLSETHQEMATMIITRDLRGMTIGAALSMLDEIGDKERAAAFAEELLANNAALTFTELDRIRRLAPQASVAERIAALLKDPIEEANVAGYILCYESDDLTEATRDQVLDVLVKKGALPYTTIIARAAEASEVFTNKANAVLREHVGDLPVRILDEIVEVAKHRDDLLAAAIAARHERQPYSLEGLKNALQNLKGVRFTSCRREILLKLIVETDGTRFGDLEELEKVGCITATDTYLEYLKNKPKHDLLAYLKATDTQPLGRLAAAETLGTHVAKISEQMLMEFGELVLANCRRVYNEEYAASDQPYHHGSKRWAKLLTPILDQPTLLVAGSNQFSNEATVFAMQALTEGAVSATPELLGKMWTSSLPTLLMEEDWHTMFTSESTEKTAVLTELFHHDDGLTGEQVRELVTGTRSIMRQEVAKIVAGMSEQAAVWIPLDVMAVLAAEQAWQFPKLTTLLEHRLESDTSDWLTLPTTPEPATKS